MEQIGQIRLKFNWIARSGLNLFYSLCMQTLDQIKKRNWKDLCMCNVVEVA